MNPFTPQADLLASLRRAEADASHKLGLIRVAAKKGPKAILAATQTAAKAVKRRDALAKKLNALRLETEH